MAEFENGKLILLGGMLIPIVGTARAWRYR